MTVFLSHSKMELALHELRSGTGRPLLWLHGLGERSPGAPPVEVASWPGPVFALDFTGHGASRIPRAGGYTAELLMGDADTALAHLGPCTVVGRGLGAYVALLIAGGRSELVRGAILRDGPGLAGGGSGTTTPYIPAIDTTRKGPPDPFALAELARDIRPRDYAQIFVRLATSLSGLATPVFVCATERPDWLTAVVAEVGVEVTTFDAALRATALLDSRQS